MQAATLWDRVTCASNCAPSVGQFGTQQTVHVTCRNTAALHKQSDRRHFSFTATHFAALCCACPRASHFVDACNFIHPLVKNLKFLLLLLTRPRLIWICHTQKNKTATNVLFVRFGSSDVGDGRQEGAVASGTEMCTFGVHGANMCDGNLSYIRLLFR